ncbi:uncharacterized protein [Leptinotarsa decemlineata]|uniref:uncharacterized protein n=1 Tax=Leptinotarsa decemlineata TaxID=7539 RepID=UPI003D30AF8A
MDIYKSKWFAFDSIQFLMNRDEPRKGLNTENDEAELDDLEVSRESNKEQAQLEDEGVDMRSPAPSIQSFHSQPSSASLPTLKRNKKQKQPAEDPRLQRAFEIMESASNRRRSAQHIAQKLIGYSVRTRALVEREINTVLFRADMGYCDDSPACTITMRQIVPNPPSTVTALPEYPAAILHNFRPSPHYTYTTPSTPAPSPQNANLTSSTPASSLQYTNLTSSTPPSFPQYTTLTISTAAPSPQYTTPTPSIPAPSPVSDETSTASTSASYYGNPSSTDSATSQYFTRELHPRTHRGINSLIQGAVVHWDGKSLPDILSEENIKRVCKDAFD